MSEEPVVVVAVVAVAVAVAVVAVVVLAVVVVVVKAWLNLLTSRPGGGVASRRLHGKSGQLAFSIPPLWDSQLFLSERI